MREITLELDDDLKLHLETMQHILAGMETDAGAESINPHFTAGGCASCNGVCEVSCSAACTSSCINGCLGSSWKADI